MAAPDGSRLLGHVSAFRRDPLQLLEECSPPYARLWLGRPIWLLLEPADVVHVLRDHSEAYTKGPAFRYGKRLYGNSLLVSEGEDHAEQSRVVGSLFFRHAAQHFLSSVTDFTEKLTQSWQSGQRLDLWATMNQLTLAISSRAIFGQDYLPTWLPGGSAEAEQILRSYDDVMAHVARQNFSMIPLPDWLPVNAVRRYRQAVCTLETAVTRAIARRKQEGDRGGLIDQLDELLPIEQVRDQALILTLGGYESATSALCWTLLILGREKDVHRRMLQEVRAVLGDRPAAPDDADRLPYTRQVLNESLRLYPPPWLIPRACPRGDCLPSGLKLPPGAMLFLSPYRMQRDERYFKEPHRFDPERCIKNAPPPGVHFPFGFGSRRCLGENIAIQQLVLILANLCHRWLFVRDDLPAPNPVLTLRPTTPLWVTLMAAPS